MTVQLVVAVVLLTGVALVVGGWGWPQLGRASDDESSTLLHQLPMWLLMVAAAVVTIATAMTLVRRLPARPPGRPLLILLVVSALAGIVNALTFAGSAGPFPGPVIPIFHWLFTLVTSLLTGLAGVPADERIGVQGALAGAVVAVPFQALAWSLFYRFDTRGAAVEFAVRPTLILAVTPMVVAVALVLLLQVAARSDPGARGRISR